LPERDVPGLTSAMSGDRTGSIVTGQPIEPLWERGIALRFVLLSAPQEPVLPQTAGLEQRLGDLEAQIRRLTATLLHSREQAESLTEICVNTAGSAQTGIERAEARLATLEHDLHRKIDHLSRDLHEVLAELRHRAGPFPESTGETHVTTPADQSEAARDHEIDQRAPADRFSWKWYAAAVAALVIAMIVVAGVGWSFYRRANLAVVRASEAQQRAERIAVAANERIEATRQDAAAQVARARDAASKAQVTSDVLAASDLVRFNLVGSDPAVRTLAQLLWSRSRGMVFSASRMPQPPQGAVYQIWLLTAAAAISLGTIAPDASGRVTLATDTPPDAPRPIVGVRVTLEPASGRAEPSGPIVLAREQ